MLYVFTFSKVVNRNQQDLQCHTLINLACAQDNAEEQYADIDSEEETKDIPLQDPSSSEENYQDLEWCLKLPSDETDLHYFVEEQKWLDKTTAPNISENS
jgi:hypothetical protein